MHPQIEKELANNRVAAILTSIEWNDVEGDVVNEHYADLVRMFGGNYMLRVLHSDTEKSISNDLRNTASNYRIVLL